MSKDYYKILGVSRSASPDEIKFAFRKLAHQYHPDKKGGDTEKFKEINSAYQALSDPEKRAKYDQFGEAFEQQGAGPGFQGFGNFDFSQAFDLGDAFGDLFGMGGRRGGTRARDLRGDDIAIDMELSFRDAAFGVARPVKLYKTIACAVCDGSGVEPGSKLTQCRECGGKGQTAHAQRTVFGAFQTVRTCAACSGLGQVPEKVCKHCAGSGVEKKQSEIEVAIPSGVEDGMTVRLKGQGEAGRHGGSAGDLYIRLHVSADARFSREGDSVLSTVSIPLTTALLGGEVEVETLDGAVSFSIPEGTRHGSEFRLKGKGIVHPRGGRGDQVVTVEIRMPKKLSKEQRGLIEEFRKTE